MSRAHPGAACAATDLRPRTSPRGLRRSPRRRTSRRGRLDRPEWPPLPSSGSWCSRSRSGCSGPSRGASNARHPGSPRSARPTGDSSTDAAPVGRGRNRGDLRACRPCRRRRRPTGSGGGARPLLPRWPPPGRWSLGAERPVGRPRRSAARPPREKQREASHQCGPVGGSTAHLRPARPRASGFGPASRPVRGMHPPPHSHPSRDSATSSMNRASPVALPPPPFT